MAESLSFYGWSLSKHGEMDKKHIVPLQKTSDFSRWNIRVFTIKHRNFKAEKSDVFVIPDGKYMKSSVLLFFLFWGLGVGSACFRWSSRSVRAWCAILNLLVRICCKLIAQVYICCVFLRPSSLFLGGAFSCLPVCLLFSPLSVVCTIFLYALSETGGFRGRVSS